MKRTHNRCDQNKNWRKLELYAIKVKEIEKMGPRVHQIVLELLSTIKAVDYETKSPVLSHSDKKSVIRSTHEVLHFLSISCFTSQYANESTEVLFHFVTNSQPSWIRLKKFEKISKRDLFEVFGIFEAENLKWVKAKNWKIWWNFILCALKV